MSHDVADRHYVIIPYSSVDSVDFGEVMETSRDAVRRSVSGNLTLVKYRGDMPASVLAIENHSPEYSHAEIMELMATPVWSSPEVDEG